MEIQEKLFQEAYLELGGKQIELEKEDGEYTHSKSQIAWEIWQKATPEGFVLVSTENISTFYQDDSEPENFCTYEADLDILGDGLDKGEIMVVNKYTQAELTKEKFYGAWCEIETTCGTSRKFKIFKTYDEAKQAMIEAQEQSHELD